MTEPAERRPSTESEETEPVTPPGGDSPDPDFDDDATIPDPDE